MKGQTGFPEPGHPGYTYYVCTHNPKNPRHVAAYPDHAKTVKVREDHLIPVIAQFLDERVFGADRAAHLAATLPANHAEDAARRERQAAALHKSCGRSTPPRTPTPAKSKPWPACPKTHPPSPRCAPGSSNGSPN
jgi:hypothetical protein